MSVSPKRVQFPKCLHDDPRPSPGQAINLLLTCETNDEELIVVFKKIFLPQEIFFSTKEFSAQQSFCRWDTPTCDPRTSGRFHGRRGRSCSSGGPGTPGTWSEKRMALVDLQGECIVPEGNAPTYLLLDVVELFLEPLDVGVGRVPVSVVHHQVAVALRDGSCRSRTRSYLSRSRRGVLCAS